MGANVCIGRGLAWSSMRIVMARMLFQFDWTVDGDGGKSFENAKAWHVWMKNPVRLKLVEKGTLYPNILT
jgi:cytochrome P450